MNKRETVWQIAHGETPDNIKNNPALKSVTIPRTGFFTNSNGVRGALLRAYDKATGKDVGAVFMPAGQTGTPMTYMLNGKQYILLAISGGTYSGELLAFRLPN